MRGRIEKGAGEEERSSVREWILEREWGGKGRVIEGGSEEG